MADKYDKIQNKEIVKLVRSLERMPLYLAEKELEYYVDIEFRRSVWEEACLKAGLIKKRSFDESPEG